MLLLVSALVVAASHFAWWPIAVAEAWGFASGGVCVWLVVREHPWNWPIGLANNVAFFALFLKSRLYADMALQVVYFGLGIYGWLNWALGGTGKSGLTVSRTSRREAFAIAVLLPVMTVALQRGLLWVNGAAPWGDAATTALSLVAQYLLCRKRLENWWFWIAADLLYVPLYLSRDLPLTAVLYAVFLVMCVIGLRAWRRPLTGGREHA